jgi:large subunit ribosomal protein L22
MQASARLSTIRLSPLKGRLVADQVRGMDVSRATTLLKFSNRRAAHVICKVLESAIANAENNLGADVDDLKVHSIMIDEGPRLKRMMARAKGRGSRIMKRTAHITVTVGDGRKE